MLKEDIEIRIMWLSCMSFILPLIDLTLMISWIHVAILNSIIICCGADQRLNSPLLAFPTDIDYC